MRLGLLPSGSCCCQCVVGREAGGEASDLSDDDDRCAARSGAANDGTMERWNDGAMWRVSGLQVKLAPRRFEALATMEQFVV